MRVLHILSGEDTLPCQQMIGGMTDGIRIYASSADFSVDWSNARACRGLLALLLIRTLVYELKIRREFAVETPNADRTYW